MNPLCLCGCGGETKGLSKTIKGHHNRLPEVKEKKRLACQLKYGCDNPNQSDIIKKQKIQTNLKNLGVSNPMQSKEIQIKTRKTNEEKYGGPSPMCCETVQTKSRKANLEHYGFEYSIQSKEVQEQVKNTNNKRYGGTGYSVFKLRKKSEDTLERTTGFRSAPQDPKVRIKIDNTMIRKYNGKSPFCSKNIQDTGRFNYQKKTGYTDWMHNPTVLDKIIKNSFRRKEYILPSNKIIFLQGEEPNFLDYGFKNYLFIEDEIEIHPQKIEYFTPDGKKHYYFCDFRLKSFDLYIEIKSSWIYKIQPNNDLKFAATLSGGHKHIMILDKNYIEFINLINKLKTEVTQKETITCL